MSAESDSALFPKHTKVMKPPSSHDRYVRNNRIQVLSIDCRLPLVIAGCLMSTRANRLPVADSLIFNGAALARGYH